MTIPRRVIAGTSSNVCKTTVMVGLVRALRARGLRVAVFKCGFDYLAPTYHVRAADAPCRRGGELFQEGYRTGNTLASYVHAHWASNPLLAQGFVQACAVHARRAR